MNSISVLGFDIATDSVDKIVLSVLNRGGCSVINTLNPHSYVEQKSDATFRNALMGSDLLIPDGSGIVMAAKVLHGFKLTKIAGYDLFRETMKQLEGISGRVFFLGSTESVLSCIRVRLAKEFPNIVVQTLSPPFKKEFELDDIKYFSESINGFLPDVVFVGLTAPKQEKLIRDLRSYCSPKFFSGIGAVFDFYAGSIKRPSNFWVGMHLEWLVRLVGEPKRLWKRNFVSTPIFLVDVIKSKWLLR